MNQSRDDLLHQIEALATAHGKTQDMLAELATLMVEITRKLRNQTPNQGASGTASNLVATAPAAAVRDVVPIVVAPDVAPIIAATPDDAAIAYGVGEADAGSANAIASETPATTAPKASPTTTT